MKNEIKLAIRRLFHARLVTLLALATLALGVGANSAIFTVVNAILIRPLPFPQSDQLISVERLVRGNPSNLSAPAFLGMQERARSMQLAVYYDGDPTLTGAGEPERLPATWVSDGYFDVMGVQPILGRVFRKGENETGQNRVIVLSEGVWRSRFGADPNIIGKPVAIDARPHTVVGIMPQWFGTATERQFWLPIEYDADFRDIGNFNAHWLTGVGRLRDGATVERAASELASSYLALQKLYQRENRNVTITAQPLRDAMVGEVREPLLILLGAVGLVLLIACANLANLLLAQAAGRHTEFAVRRALGASQPRLIGQLFVESIVLAFMGGALGLLIGSWGAALLAQMQSDGIAGFTNFSVDWRVIGFTAGVSLLAAILFGIAPAVQVARYSPAPMLREGGRGGVGSRRSNRIRSSLVVVETALAIMLLIGAGLLLRSFAQLQNVNPGFRPEQTLSFELQLPSQTYETDEAQIRFMDQLTERLRLPGVRAVGAANILPLTGNNMSIIFNVDGRPEPPAEQVAALDIRIVTPDFLEAMGIPVERGRGLDARDRAGSEPVVLINAAAAAMHFPNEDPIGKRIVLGWTRDSTNTPVAGRIVGVVASVRAKSLADNPRPELYIPYAQVPDVNMTVVARAQADPDALRARIRETLREIDPNLAVSNVRTLETVLQKSLAPRRFYTSLLGSFAAVALLLAAVGIFGVISVMVAQRRGEIGVRMALGAAPRQVVNLVVGDALRLVIAGVVIGLIAAFWVTGVLKSLLFGIGPTDPVTFGGTALILIGVAIAASALPALNAGRTDPNVVLRAE